MVIVPCVYVWCYLFCVFSLVVVVFNYVRFLPPKKIVFNYVRFLPPTCAFRPITSAFCPITCAFCPKRVAKNIHGSDYGLLAVFNAFPALFALLRQSTWSFIPETWSFSSYTSGFTSKTR
jgi:hypothetical protein